MGETDQLMYQYLSNNERFADLVNGYVGFDLIKASELEEQDNQLISKVDKEIGSKPIKKVRDIIRKSTKGIDFILIGIENQMEIDYSMPIRVMVYDALNYEKQLTKIKERNKKRKGFSSAEFLARFRKKDKVNPVVTIVVYYGKKPWDGALDLHGAMNLDGVPEHVRNMIYNHPINLLQINSFEGVERLQTDLRVVFGFLRNMKSKEGMHRFIEENSEEFDVLGKDSCDVITHFAGDMELIQYKEKYKVEGGYKMCQAIREMVEDGRLEGRTEGENRLSQLIAMMIADNCGAQIERVVADSGFLKQMYLKYNL